MASLLLRVSPQIQISLRRAFATSPAPEVLSPSKSLNTKHADFSSSAELKIKIDARAESQANTKAKAQADTKTRSHLMMLLFEGPKEQRLAYATVIVAAVGADVTFSYFTFFHGRKEGEAIRTDTVYDTLAQKIAPYLINEDGLSPFEK